VLYKCYYLNIIICEHWLIFISHFVLFSPVCFYKKHNHGFYAVNSHREENCGEAPKAVFTVTKYLKKTFLNVARYLSTVFYLEGEG